jgi:hypothetical protein
MVCDGKMVEENEIGSSQRETWKLEMTMRRAYRDHGGACASSLWQLFADQLRHHPWG